MKRLTILFGSAFFCIALCMLASCKKDTVDPNLPVLKLHPDNITRKSGQVINDTLDILAPYGAKTLVISKTVNLVADNVFGTQIVTPVSNGTNTFIYIFTYTCRDDEVDKLVGINFRFEDEKGNAAEKDLTINTAASGAQTIYTRNWKLISKVWESLDPPQENIADCEKDDIWKYNKDSTISLNYGTSGCLFDGFNIFDKWYLSPDEKKFTRIYHSIFDPTKITVEEYDIKSITSDKLIMEIALDLSVFGLSDRELFLYTYQSQ